MNAEKERKLEAFFDELRHYLYDPNTPINYDRPLCLKNGQVLIIERDGYQLRRGNADNKNMDLELIYLTTRYMCIIAPHSRHVDSSKNPIIRMTNAAVSEYCGARDWYRPSAENWHQYQAIKQQVYANLNEINRRLNIQFTPLVQPEHNFFRRPSTKWEWIRFLIVVALLLPPALYVSRAYYAPQAKFPWEYDYYARYGNNHAYDNLGKSAKEYTALVRAFKAKHPKEFSEIAKSNDVRNLRGLPEEFGLLWGINTDEAQRFIRANFNIHWATYDPKTNRAKPGWLTINQATAIILREAKAP